MDTLSNCGILAYRYVSILDLDFTDKSLYNTLRHDRSFSPNSLDLIYNRRFVMGQPDNYTYQSRHTLKWSECSSLDITTYLTLVINKFINTIFIAH